DGQPGWRAAHGLELREATPRLKPIAAPCNLSPDECSVAKAQRFKRWLSAAVTWRLGPVPNDRSSLIAAEGRNRFDTKRAPGRQGRRHNNRDHEDSHTDHVRHPIDPTDIQRLRSERPHGKHQEDRAKRETCPGDAPHLT